MQSCSGGKWRDTNPQTGDQPSQSSTQLQNEQAAGMSCPELADSAHSGCLHSSFNPAYTAEGDLGRTGEGGMRVNGLGHDSHISRAPEKYITNFDKVTDIA